MKSLFVCFLIILTAGTACATTVNGQFVVVANNGTTFSVKVQIQVDVAAGLGGTTLAFTFNASNLGFPSSPVSGVDYTFHNFSGGSYSPATVTKPLSNKVSINTEYNGNVGGGTPVAAAPAWTDVVTINFSTINWEGSSNLTWVTTQAIADDQVTPWTAGTFANLNTTPLPITLSSFTGQPLQNGAVRLDWTTLSEIDNCCFYVERKGATEQTFIELPNSFVLGQGTTNVPHYYSFTDSTVTAGTWQYRLKQVDNNGAIHRTDAIQVDVLMTGVKEGAPREFALLQNYPNPFNPETEIKFAVEKTERTTLWIYNLIGEEVATLFDDIAEPGQYYRVRVSGSGLASGVYFYRLQSGTKSNIRKMILMK